MIESDTKDDATLFSCPYSAGGGFDYALKKAEALVQNEHLEEALDLLTVAERSYVRAAKLFDLLGDVLLRCGNIEEGIRYKTLHEVLKGTFKIATDESERGEDRSSRTENVDRALGLPGRPGGQKVCAPMDEGAFAPCGIPEGGGRTRDFIPLTAAMGHEFMRQGHFDRALEIFTLLAARRPEDESLQEAKEQARRKDRQTVVLDVLQRWLGNIERMKSTHPSEV